MINKQNNEKENVMENVVVRVEKSGNRYNAWDSLGNKWTSDITTGARKKAFNNNKMRKNMLLLQGFFYFFVFPDFASNRCTFLVSTPKQPQKKRFRQSLLDHILLRTVHITPSFSL